MGVEETQAAKLIAELQEQIRKHDQLYYEEAAPITDSARRRKAVTSLRAGGASHPDAQPR